MFGSESSYKYTIVSLLLYVFVYAKIPTKA